MLIVQANKNVHSMGYSHCRMGVEAVLGLHLSNCGVIKHKTASCLEVIIPRDDLHAIPAEGRPCIAYFSLSQCSSRCGLDETTAIEPEHGIISISRQHRYPSPPSALLASLLVLMSMQVYTLSSSRPI